MWICLSKSENHEIQSFFTVESLQQTPQIEAFLSHLVQAGMELPAALDRLLVLGAPIALTLDPRCPGQVQGVAGAIELVCCESRGHPAVTTG